MDITAKIRQHYRYDGLAGLVRRGTAYALRRCASRLEALAARLNYSTRIAAKAERRLVAPNAALHNLHRGRRCFIIGNGPSLAEQDLAPLAGEITFAMNSFWKHPIVAHWQPTYYCFADPIFFDGSEACTTFFAALRARIHATKVFVPLRAHDVVEGQRLFGELSVHFIRFSGSLAKRPPAPPDMTAPLPDVKGVAQMAMLLAICMGCSPIYLLGLDHDWLAHRGMDRHFYRGVTIEQHQRTVNNLSTLSYRHLMESQLELWSGYEALQQIAHMQGIEIVNATHGGFLDIFPRADYAALFDPAPSGGG